MHKLTVFTPTYNRAKLLPRLYNSLLNQSCLDFEWLIVDDGSTDNTKELVEQWIMDDKISINYYKQENQGKYVAHNFGVNKCKTEFFICVDSDDWLVSDAIGLILDSLHTLKSLDIVGLVSYRGKNQFEIIQNEFPENLKFSTLNNLYNQGFKGDTSLVFKTNILREYMFPESNEKFFPEQYIYDQIDHKYLLYVLPKIIIVCEYQIEGYTNNIYKVIKQSPNNYILTLNQRLKFDDCFKEKCKDTIRYVAISMASHKKKFIAESVYPYLTILLLPFGWLFKKLRYDRN